MPCMPWSRGSWARGVRLDRQFATTSTVRGRPPPDLVDLNTLHDEAAHRMAQSWVSDFQLDDIPRKSCEISYARSSGAGGQHVNKTSSKAVVRLPLSAALGSWLPRYVLPEIQRSSYYLPNPPALLVSSQVTRSAPENLQKAFVLLHKTIKEAAERPIVGETSPDQRERVQGLAAKEKAKRKMMKERQKANKAARRGEW